MLMILFVCLLICFLFLIANMKIKQRTYNRLFNTYKYTGCGILFSHLKFLFSLHAVLYFAYDSSKGKPKK